MTEAGFVSAAAVLCMFGLILVSVISFCLSGVRVFVWIVVIMAMALIMALALRMLFGVEIPSQLFHLNEKWKRGYRH